MSFVLSVFSEGSTSRRNPPVAVLVRLSSQLTPCAETARSTALRRASGISWLLHLSCRSQHIEARSL